MTRDEAIEFLAVLIEKYRGDPAQELAAEIVNDLPNLHLDQQLAQMSAHVKPGINRW